MPKLKTHTGAAKRFKKTGTGKIVRHQTKTRHILSSKSPKLKRKLGKSMIVSDGDHAKVARMIPYARPLAVGQTFCLGLCRCDEWAEQAPAGCGTRSLWREIRQEKASEEVYRAAHKGSAPPASSRTTERKMENQLCLV